MSVERYLITGCSGGGKSTLLSELNARGHRVVKEPGRRIIADELAKGGDALPWINMKKFVGRALDIAREDMSVAGKDIGPVFFDRGLIDAVAALHHLTGMPLAEIMGDEARYEMTVFVVPPWEELFSNDADRRHSFDSAVEEHNRILDALDQFGYEPVMLEPTTVGKRAEHLLGVVASVERPT